MKISDGERLIAVMLAEVMEAMSLKEEIDPTFVKKVLINQDDWALSWKYSGLFPGEAGPDDDTVAETSSILSMMSFIEYSINQLPVEQQAEFSNLEFIGFDGNHDRHYSVAITLIEDLDRFSEFAGRTLNSHGAATAEGYLRIKPAYDRAMQGCSGNALSAGKLRDILAARDL